MTKLRKKIFFRQLKVQITSYYLLASLLVVLLMSGVYYYSSSAIILEDSLEQTVYAVEQSGQDLDNFLSELKKTAVFISENPHIKAYLSHGDQASKVGGHQMIDQVLATHSSIVSIVAVGKNGGVLSNETELEMSVSNDMMDEPWYVNAIDNQQMPALTSARLQKFTMDKDTWVIALSQEIFDEDNKNLGVLLVDIKYQVIEGYLDHLPLGQEGFAFIIDDDQSVVYHPNPEYFTNQSKKDNLLAMVEGKEGYDAKAQVLTQPYVIPNTHWTLVGVSSLDRLGVVRRQLIEVMILIAGLVFVAIIIGGYIIATRITQPIKSLQDAMGNFNSLKSSIELPTGCYEVEALTVQFNRMLQEIQRLLRDIKDKEQYLRTYELNALYSQINPHFLYNTLDTIVWMAEFNDSEKVIEVTKSLAQFFRISLSNGQEMITLDKEFEHIKQYLFIQKQRYEDQLTYHIDLDDSLRDLEVPKIILQPIVENALYHGIREQDGGGSIWIRAKNEKDFLSLTVTDDGVGFDINHKVSKTVKLGGVGLENVEKRLALVYGPGGQLAIESQVGHGTRVSLRIPFAL